MIKWASKGKALSLQYTCAVLIGLPLKHEAFTIA